MAQIFLDKTRGIIISNISDEKGQNHIFMFAPENWTHGDGVILGT
tara:strand:- start:381 stop:515 length:135 start_codon:yes stop_codon:yes gene_type:complete